MSHISGIIILLMLMGAHDLLARISRNLSNENGYKL